MALPTGALHDWQFDQESGGTLPDQIGTEDLSEQSSPVSTTFGRDMDGLDDYYTTGAVEGALDPELDFDNDFTFAVMFKAFDDQETSVAHAVQVDTGGGTDTYFNIQVRRDNLNAVLEEVDTGTRHVASADWLLYAGDPILVTARWDASAASLEMWVNDGPITPITEDEWGSGGHGLGFGGRADGGGDHFKGELSRSVFYDRRLSDSEMQELFDEMGAYAYARGETLDGYTPVTEVPVTGIASAEAFGTPTLQPGAVTLAVAGIASQEAIGAPQLAPGPVTLTPASIASEEALGTPQVTADTVILEPLGIPSAEAFGTPSFALGAISRSVVGIASQEAFGTPSFDLSVVFSPMGIPSAESVQGVSIQTGPISRSVVGIASQEAFGTVTVSSEQRITGVGGIPSEEAIPSPTFAMGSVTVMVTGIPSAEKFGVVNRPEGTKSYARVQPGNIDRGAR